MGWLLVMVGVAIVFFYIIVPVKVRADMWMSADPVFDPVNPSDARIPAEVRAFWDLLAAPLADLGFTPVQGLVNANTTPNSTGYIHHLVNPRTGDEAVAYVIITRAAPIPVRRVYTVEFCTTFVDGRSVCTHSTDQLPSVFRVPWRTTVRVPGLGDLAQLYRVHQSVAAELGGTKSPLPSAGNVATVVRDSVLREYQSWVDSGYYRRDNLQQRLLLTWKGSYLAAWSMLWPISAIRRWSLDGRARQWLRQAGLPEHYVPVKYAQAVQRRMAEAPPPAAGGLQFDQAEFAQAPAPGTVVRCSTCQRPIADSYWEIDGKTTCSNCRATPARAAAGAPVGRFVRAIVGGAAAGLLGAAIYFGVAAITGYEIGLVALVVGLLVGLAVRWGARGRGGWLYQALAMLLAYLAIGTSYAAFAIRDVIRNPEVLHRAAATAAAPTSSSATRPSAFEPTTAAAASQPTTQPISGLDVLIGLVALGLLVVSMPVLAAAHAPFSLVFTGIALWEAWKLNKRAVQRISGPYAVGPPPAAPPVGPPESSAHV